MKKPITITLGESKFEIQPLTISQTRDIWATVGMGGAPLPDVRSDIKRNFDIPIGVLAIALSDGHPEMTAEEIGKLRFTRDEMNAAHSKVCAFSGLTIIEDPKPGEAKPGT